MRYYTEIQNRKNDFFRNMIRYPYTVFATDLMFFCSRFYEQKWEPFIYERKIGVYEEVQRVPRTYTPHPMSPFNENMKEAMKIILTHKDEKYKKHFETLTEMARGDHLRVFLDYFLCLVKASVQRKWSPIELFFMLVQIGRITILFFERSMKDIMYIAPELLAFWVGSVMAMHNLLPDAAFYYLNIAALKACECFGK